jgi:putative hydrolase of the HAD superfamily
LEVAEVARALTFDFWNTLYRMPDGIRQRRARVLGQLLADAGQPRSAEAVEAALEGAWREAWLMQRVHGMDITPRGHVEHIKKSLGVRVDAELDERLYRAYAYELLEVPPPLNHGACEVLETLAGRYVLAVVCNTGASPGVVLRRIMEADGLLAHFRATVFSDEVTWAKPNTRIFRHALGLLGVSEGDAVHVGDDSLTDVIGAKLAGMRAVWLQPEAGWPVPECDWHIRALPELLDIF